MFSFAPGLVWYPRIGLVLMMVELALFVTGLPPFHTGIWLQTEPNMVAMFSLAGLDAVWLLAGFMRGWLLPQKSNIVWKLMLAWVAWQFVPTLFSFLPYRSWFGPVEMGEGMGWHMAWLIMATKAIALWQVQRLRMVLLVWAAVVLSTESLLHVLFSSRTNVYVPNVWIPAQWGAYLAFMVGYFWVLMALGGYMARPAVYGVLMFFVMDVVVVSYNKSAIALMPLALLVCGFFYLRGRQGLNLEVPRRVRQLAALGCVVPMLWVGLGVVYKAEDTGEVTDSLLHLSHKDGSLGSRVGLIQVSASAMAHEPMRWLVGAGWGEYNDSMFKYALVDGVRMYYKGERRPNWAFVDGNAYHSHCQPLEALLALGLPGLLLWLAMPMAALMRLPAGYFWQVAPVMLVVVTVGYLWFQLPQCVPMQALMWAALAVACNERVETARRRHTLHTALAGLAVVLMVLSASQQYTGMWYGEKLFKGTRTDKPTDYPMEWIMTDVYRGSDRLRVSAMGYALSLDKEKGDVDARQRDWYALMMQAADRLMRSPYTGERAKYLNLWLEYKLLLNLGYPNFEELGQVALHDMRESVLTVARVAPLRDDIASFYFLNFEEVTKGDKALQEAILRELLEAAPNHRSARWILGHLLLEKPATKAEGEAMLRATVADGVEGVYPITEAQAAPWR